MTQTQTREQWLSQATTELRSLFKQHGVDLPHEVRSSCGFPSKSALSASSPTQYMTQTHVRLHYVALRRLGHLGKGSK